MGRPTLGLAFIAVLATMLIGAAPASAHATLVSSQPANGAVLTTAPERATLEFSETVVPAASSVRLVDHTGRGMPSGPTTTSPDQLRVTLVLPRLAPGTYGLLWRTLAEDDGHATSGTVVFSIGAPDADTTLAAGSATSQSLTDIARRWSGILALAVLAGAVALAALLQLERGVGQSLQPVRRRLRAIALAGVGAGLAVSLWDFVVEQRRTTRPVSFDAAWSVLTTRWGELWLARVLCLIAVAVVLVYLRPEPKRLAVAGVLLAARVLTEAMAGHAASASPPLEATAADAVHIATASVWLGSVLCVAAALRAAAPGARRGVARAYRVPFSALMAFAAALAVASGLYSAGLEVPSVPAATGTTYGRTLLVKLGILVVLCVVAAGNSLRLHLGRRLPLRGVAAEVTLAVVLFGAAAVLVETAPPTESAHGSVATSARAADLVVDARLDPTGAGSAAVTAVIASSRRPPPAPIAAVRLRVDGHSVRLHRTGVDRYFGTVPGTRAGAVAASLLVERGGRPLVVRLSFPDADGAGSLRTVTTALAAAVLLFVAVGAVGLRRRSRGRDEAVAV